MTAKNFVCVVVLAIGGSLSSFADERDWTGENVQCVVSGLNDLGIEEHDSQFPKFSEESVVKQSQVRALAASLTGGQAERIQAVFRDSGFRRHELQTRADYLRAHEEIYLAFQADAGRVFGVSECGDQASVGAQIYIVLGDWLMSAYGERTSWDRLRPEGSSFFATDLVRTAVVMELIGVEYDFSSLSAAMGFPSALQERAQIQ